MRQKKRLGAYIASALVLGLAGPGLTSTGADALTLRPVIPGAPALMTAFNAADSVDSRPGVTTKSAASGTFADVDAAATAVNTSGCNTQTVANTVGTGASRQVTIFGADTTFSVGAISKFWWRTPPNPVPVWSLYFRGLMWIGPAIATGATDPASINAFVEAAARSVEVNPDTGTSTFGWDEGTNLRRQMALNCLYRASGGDPRLLPAITATAKANMDAKRYYGLPYHLPHNHGVMANLALLDAADLLNNAAWRNTATQRLLTDSAGAFTANGFTIEQSACYQMVNVNLWGSVAEALEASPDPTTRTRAAQIQATVDKARSAAAHVTTPAGRLAPYGDCQDEAGVTTHPVPGGVRDDAAGVTTGRWSWTDPNTTFYLVRYGPRRYAHGHEDRGSLIWSTLGMPVLNDTGVFSYNPGPYNAYGFGTAGHNVQIVPGRTFVTGAPVTMTARTSSGSVHTVTLNDSQYGLSHTRRWAIDNLNHQVTLTDTVAAAAQTRLHLDSAWSRVSLSADRKVATFRHTNGRTLTVRGSAAMTINVGVTNPVGGWRFPRYDVRLFAPEIVMAAPAGTSTVTLKVN